MRHSTGTLGLLLLGLLGLAAAQADELDLDDVGQVDLTNSGAPEAQQAFQHGLAQLHNFEYAAAAADFREARRIDPDFALAYWGEAMTHNHPIWMEQDREAALAVLDRYAPSPEARQRRAPEGLERDLLAAVDVLFGPSPKEDRDDAYARAMARLHEQYPEQVDVAAFRALAVLGTAHEGRDPATYMRAAAIALDYVHEHPRHPGIAHYLIHATDDPVHAPLGLRAARAYAEIAPNAAHAQHMTTHIFLALGDWDGVVRANTRATALLNQEREARGLAPVGCGHYPSWLMYGHLQRGEIEPAREIMMRCAGNIDDGLRFRGVDYYAWQRALYLFDTGAWGGAIADLELPPGSDRFVFEDTILQGWISLGRGDPEGAAARLEAARGLEAALQDAWEAEGVPPSRPRRRETAVQLLQLEGRLAVARNDVTGGLARLREAVAREGVLPFGFGPPRPPKPSLELLGETLLELGRPAEAAAALRQGLERTPGRRASLGALAAAEAALAARNSGRDPHTLAARGRPTTGPELQGPGPAP